VAVSLPVYIAVLVWDAARRVPESVKASLPPNAHLGFELGPLMRSHPVATGVWLVAAFAIGFLLGFRVFLRRSSPQTL
jgi:hypothetical protein